MAVSLKMISVLLDELGVKYRANEERNATELSLPTATFRNADTELSLFVVIRAGSGGRLLALFAPAIYRLAENSNALATAKALLWANGVAKYCRYSLDLEDGMVNLSAVVPVGDGTLLPGQLDILLTDLRDVVDHFHPVIQLAVDEGRIVLPDEEKDEVESLLASITKMTLDQLQAARKALEEAAAQGAAKDEEPEAPEML